MKKISLYEITCPNCGTVAHEISDDNLNENIICDANITIETKREDGSVAKSETVKCGTTVNIEENARKIVTYNVNDLLFFWAKRSAIGALKKEEKE